VFFIDTVFVLLYDAKLARFSLMDATLLKQPSAFLPIAMSATALAIVLIHIAIWGHAREVDEGGAAHLWQLLMAGQFLGMAYFAARWIPKSTGAAMRVIALQIAAAVAACAPVYWFNL
jgi:hypothetical protein